MLFNSFDFIIFAALFFVFYPLLKRLRNLRFLYIICASFIFYGWWDWRYLFLIVTSGLIDFVAGYAIFKYKRWRKFFLALSLLGNLGILFTFKYLIWFVSNIEFLFFELFDYEVSLTTGFPSFIKVLPIGISFYTFQSLSYTIDVYRGRLKPTKNPLLFFCYLAMFPQLVAGPIIRARDIISQLNKPGSVGADDVYAGLRRIARGFFKKMVIADTIAPFVESAFAQNAGDHGCLFWWIAVTAFAVQIYCDFSGYSDIAIGLAKWMGLDFKINFDHPYISSSLREFWSRWHISLSTWFRDYLYVPLGGSRVSSFRAQANMWITMVISGVWHGAAGNFVAWGVVHAFFLSVERFFGGGKEKEQGSIRLACSTILTMILVWVAWVFFRSTGVQQAFGIVVSMFNIFNFSLVDIQSIPLIIVPVVMLVLLHETYIFFKLKIGLHFKAFDLPWVQALVTALLLAICLFYRGQGNAFIYFQF